MNNTKYGFKSLSDADCERIYSLSNSVSRQKLAQQFGVSDRTIGRVIAALKDQALSVEIDADLVDPTPTVAQSTAVDVTVQPVEPQLAFHAKPTLPQSTEQYVSADLYDKCAAAPDSEFFSTTDGLTVNVSWNGSQKTVARSETHFQSVFQALLTSGPKAAYLLLLGKKHVIDKLFGKNNPDIFYSGGKVYYKTVELDFKTVNAAIHRYATEGNEAQMARLLNFLDKLILNPSTSAITTLYNFISHNNIELTDDGDILAFKAVTEDLKDIYTKTISNQPGEVVSMPRELVVEDPNQTCSAGLHVCSWAYLTESGFVSGGARYLKVRVNPKDVVSVPTDYKGTKMRCCEYKVIELIG